MLSGMKNAHEAVNLLGGVIAAKSDEDESHHVHQTRGLVAVRNFAEVEPQRIFRGAQPLEWWEFAWLANQLGVKTFVDLREESYYDRRMIADLLAKQRVPTDVNAIRVPVTDDKPPTIDQANQFADLVRNLKEPMFFHCSHGHGRTSTFNVIARLAQGWSLDQAIAEERDTYGYEFRIPSQVEFLKSYAAQQKELDADSRVAV